jgi:hypothetical protein
VRAEALLMKIGRAFFVDEVEKIHEVIVER